MKKIRNKSLSPYLSIRIDPRLKERFRDKVKERDDTPTQVVRRFIREYVEQPAGGR